MLKNKFFCWYVGMLARSSEKYFSNMCIYNLFYIERGCGGDFDKTEKTYPKTCLLKLSEYFQERVIKRCSLSANRFIAPSYCRRSLNGSLSFTKRKAGILPAVYTLNDKMFQRGLFGCL